MILPASYTPVLGHFDLVKRLNYAAVYQVLDKEGPIARIQLSQKSQLAPASITKIIRSFEHIGLINEIEHQVSTGGRRPVSLELASENFHVIGVRLGRDNLDIGLYTLNAKLLVKKNHALIYEDLVSLEEFLVHSLETFILENSHIIKRKIAISVTMPGIIGDVVYYLPHLAVNKWDLVSKLSSHFDCQIYIGNHVRSLALAEHYFGSTQDVRDSILISIHHGVGAGIILNGEILLGQKGNLAEIGHIQIDPLGPKCHCGQFGCLETVVANKTIKEKVARLLDEGADTLLTRDMSITQISSLAIKNDKIAMNIIKEAGNNLGKVIAILINLLNPQKIVITGELIQAEALLLSSIQRVVEKESLDNFNKSTEISIAELRHDSTLGAFALVKRRLLNGELLSQLIEMKKTY
ncbi:ROK family protein [Thorsellia kenyensis]|uniref:ROK family protein n=1 Tax=Thorsellia kenyensis TaxID=1549888 RepID=A0ABV6CC51_9GAMM